MLTTSPPASPYVVHRTTARLSLGGNPVPTWRNVGANPTPLPSKSSCANAGLYRAASPGPSSHAPLTAPPPAKPAMAATSTVRVRGAAEATTRARRNSSPSPVRYMSRTSTAQYPSSPSSVARAPVAAPSPAARRTSTASYVSAARAATRQPAASMRIAPEVVEPEPDVALGPGARVRIGSLRFRVTKPLGEGSFGVVWAAESDCGTRVAIKEQYCNSSSELERVALEVKLLDIVGQELGAADYQEDASRQVPALVASESMPVGHQSWQVRFAMTRLPGQPLEEYLETARHGTQACQRSVRTRIAEASSFAGQLLVQLAPTLDRLSAKVYHRDVTPRNILVEARPDAVPSFGLVDFGLAVDAERWRAMDEGAGDLAGDGRYWPTSAWFVFGYGTHELRKHPGLDEEYRTCLDIFSLGITALRCFVELLPPLADDGASQPLADVLPKLRAVKAAWAKYWSGAKRFWQPIYDLFRTGGGFEALRAAFVGAGVHRTVSSDLLAVRSALAEARVACLGASCESGLAGLPALFEALLMMVRAGDVDEVAPRPIARDTREAPSKIQSRRKSAAGLENATPPTTPPSGPDHSGDDGSSSSSWSPAQDLYLAMQAEHAADFERQWQDKQLSTWALPRWPSKSTASPEDSCSAWSGSLVSAATPQGSLELVGDMRRTGAPLRT